MNSIYKIILKPVLKLALKLRIYKIILKPALKLHNISYVLATRCANMAEKGLHPKHRLMNYHQFFVDNINEGDVILDIGCGNGFLAYDVARKAKKVIGIDLKEKNIKIAKEKYAAPNIKYIIGDATSYNFNKEIDAVILSNVLEHIEHRIEFLKKIKHLAQKFLIRVPMINRDWITLYKKELGVEWRLDPTHYTEYTLPTLDKELQKADLKLLDYSIQFGEIWAIASVK
ncbi:class I SAM-dependent methyltransferase [Patescibacteria group bacterium AH-259-L07]|nr:class I SAM-dependent methyltransferase [Patescibacteria group bacterium AH-259-L07]